MATLRKLLMKVFGTSAIRRATTDLAPQGRSAANWFMPPRYTSRPQPEYFHDFALSTNPPIWQPDVYDLATVVARLSGRNLVDIGCGKGGKLQRYAAGIKSIGIDFGDNIAFCRKDQPDREWREADFEKVGPFPVEPDEVRNAVVICADVIEHLKSPQALLENIRSYVDLGAIAFVSTPERALVRGRGDMGPPDNKAHVREWTLGEFRAMYEHFGLPITFLGVTANNHIDRQMTTLFAISSNAGVA
jgi:SAM-dependent methyltransferase